MWNGTEQQEKTEEGDQGPDHSYSCSIREIWPKQSFPDLEGAVLCTNHTLHIILLPANYSLQYIPVSFVSESCSSSWP